jgi:transporter family-2 protein
MNMQSRLLFILMALLIGAILPFQATVNARLAKAVDSPVMAAFISFAVGTVGLFAYLVLARQFHFRRSDFVQAPWWIWIGGLLGTFYVAGIVVLLPRLGVALAFSLVIAGQMGLAMLFDHFGWLGVPIKEISWGRIAGALLLVAGVFLIRKS